MQNILVVEDDAELNRLLAVYLRANGYGAESCFDGAQALEAFSRGNYALVISDVMMPRMDGFTLVERIRQSGSKVPVILLTAKEDKQSQLLGYKLGVDEYVVKPFDLDVLMLKVAAIMRRISIDGQDKLTVGNLTMVKSEHAAYVNGKELALTVREFDLLYKFLSYPKQTFTRSQLMDEFWDFDSSAMSRTVDVYLAKLREKTSACDGFEIVTVHGLGYKAVLK